MDELAAPQVGAPRVSTTVAMSLAATVAALIAVLGSDEPTTWITPVFALIGLIPWAIEAGGVRVDARLFVAMTMLPAAAVVLLDRNPGGLFPVLIAVVWITHRRNCASTTSVGLISAVAMTVGLGILESSSDGGTIYFLGGIGVAWLTGTMLNRQERLVAELYWATERERAHAAVEERTRIAREVHDVIAHSLTVTILHVAGARRALANDPQRAEEALERAEDVGRDSLDSIRQVVGLLRDVGDSSGGANRADETTLPQISDISSLIDQYREAGLQIDTTLRVDGICAGALTSLTVFRLVQEAVTNALQHAPGAPVSLDVSADVDRSLIRVMVENPTPSTTVRSLRSQRGLGLTGMTERVRSAGGSIDIGPTGRGTWLISAEIPLTLTKELR